MKNKIQKFSKGDFQLIRPDVIFDETNLVLIIGEGEVYRGSFTMRANNEGRIRGLVYSSSFRVHFKDQGFEGNPSRVEFTYDGRGLRPGHVEEGKFTIVCSGGEYELSFTAIIEKPYVMTTYGKVQSTDDFRKLAIKDFSEAGRLFRSKEFYEILKYENERTFYLYDNMRKWSLGEQAMEEFMVGIKQKECIFLTLQGEGMLFEDLTESTKGTLTLMKNTWGYMPIKIETVGDFIRVSRPEISTEDFVGNAHEIEYVVRAEKLHGGRNYGALKFVTPYETLTYEVEVLQNQEYDEDHRMPELLMAQIVKEYVGYMAGRVSRDHWVDSAIEKMVTLRKLEPLNEVYQLMLANIYLLGEKIEEAKWILENYNYNRFAIGKDPLTNCYYLYLTAKIRGDVNYEERVLDEVGKTYMRHQDSWWLLYMILNLDTRYKNPYKRLEVLEQQFEYGIHSVMFYLEAYLCYQEKPTLLKKLGTFEIQVLNFATKYRMMTKELALYISNFASQQKKYSDNLFRILERIYKMYDEPMILNTICTLLIKGNKTEKKYFFWYQKAVDSDLKIAQLYEYYMMTIDEDSAHGPLPKSLVLYFMHGNSLDYHKCAFLYANLITYEDEGSEIYAHYRDEMEVFAWNQLERRNIDEDLRIIYKRFLVEDEMKQERIKALYDICHAYWITTKVPNMKFIHVIADDGTVTQKVPYTEKGARVFLYSKTDRLVWEAKDGRHYTDSIPYDSKRLFYELRYMDMCRKYLGGLLRGRQNAEEEELTLEVVKEKGLENYPEDEIFTLCSKTIRESNYENDDFLTYVCYDLFQKNQYDKVILTYLANYFCGATMEMKNLWKVARDYEVHTHKLAERILTQMLFSEELFQEAQVFEAYYEEGAYFRLEQAYLAYISREYVVEERKIGKNVIDVICQEYEKGEPTIDICKIAVLKYYSTREYGTQIRKTLKKFLQELCGKQIYFPFFLSYEKEWLVELQLWDKTMIEYHGQPGSRVMLYYQLQKGSREAADYSTEVLSPMYENLYVKKFVLFANERLKYYFKETIDGNSYRSEKEMCMREIEKGEPGRYGRLNDILLEEDKEEQEKKMRSYALEDAVANHMFIQY